MDVNIDIKPSFGRIGKAFQEMKLGAELQKVIRELSFRIEGESKRVTPVDTGRLRGSITTDMRTLEAKIAPHTEYAGFVHWGTSRMAARPYMKWGVDTALSQMGENEIAKKLDVSISDKLKSV